MITAEKPATGQCHRGLDTFDTTASRNSDTLAADIVLTGELNGGLVAFDGNSGNVLFGGGAGGAIGGGVTTYQARNVQ